MNTKLVNGKRVSLTTEEEAVFQELQESNQPEITRAAEARRHRDRLLAQSDHLALLSLEKGEKVKPNITRYRKALRDLTDQPGFPDEIDWPEEPQNERR